MSSKSDAQGSGAGRSRWRRWDEIQDLFAGEPDRGLEQALRDAFDDALPGPPTGTEGGPPMTQPQTGATGTPEDTPSSRIGPHGSTEPAHIGITLMQAAQAVGGIDLQLPPRTDAPRVIDLGDD